jgi:hypothetical protein
MTTMRTWMTNPLSDDAISPPETPVWALMRALLSQARNGRPLLSFNPQSPTKEKGYDY